MYYTLGLDTIAGSKLLQLRFGPSGVFQPDQAVMHEDRRARFIGMSGGTAIIRHWGDRHPIAVSPESLSLPPAEPLERPASNPRPTRLTKTARRRTQRGAHPRRRSRPLL